MRICFLCAVVGLVACGSTKSNTAPAPQATATGAKATVVSPEGIARARTHAHAIAAAAGTWVAAHPEGVCPSVDVLKADRALDAMADDKDTWGKPFAIACSETEVTVSSAAGDGATTADDVVEKIAVASPVASSGPPASKDVPFKTNDAAAFGRDAAVAQVDQKIGVCRQKANDPSASGVVALKLVIRSDGTVKSVVAVRSKTQVKSATMLACVLKELARAQFGTTGADGDSAIEVP